MVLYPRSAFGVKIFVLGSIIFNRESMDSRFLHIVTPVIVGKAMKEAKTRITWRIRNMRKLYYFHTGTQEVSDGVTKEH